MAATRAILRDAPRCGAPQDEAGYFEMMQCTSRPCRRPVLLLHELSRT